MSHVSLRAVRRSLAQLVVIAVAVAGLTVVAASPAGAIQDVETERLAGTDRYATAAAIATGVFPDGADTVVVTSGVAFPDALAGAALGMPLLLTTRDSLPSATSDAIEELGAENAIILGGTAAVSSSVESRLTADGLATERIAGADRYATAGEIAAAIGADDVGDLDDKPTALIATGLNFADALAGGPVAATGDGTGVFPILLTNAGVPDATEEAIEALGIEQVVILGGTAAVPSSVESELEDMTGNAAVRLAGTNRYGTAVVIAEMALDDLDLPGEDVLLANGLVFADALAGGPAGAVLEAPIILTDPAQLPEPSEAWLTDHADTIATITALGGTAAVSQSALEAAEEAAETPGTKRVNEAFTVSPQGDVSQANGSTREYSVSGLGGTVVDIVLVPCANVSTGSDGTTRFTNANLNTVADRSADGTADPAQDADQASTGSAITSINGTPRPANDPTIDSNDYADDVAPDGGAVEFTVSGPASSSTTSSCVVPVVFADANQDDSLNVASPATNPAQPTEDFGTGGQVAFNPGAAQGGAIGSATHGANVDSNSEASDSFVACTIFTNSPTELQDDDNCAQYRYDANDTFQVDGKPSTMAAFEVALTVDDDVKGTYADTPAGKSTFSLIDEAPAAPTGLTARSSAPGNVVIGFTESSTESTDNYRLVRVATTATCPEYATGAYQQVAQCFHRDAPAVPGSPIPSSSFSLTDTSAAASTRYCYRVISVNDFDDGMPSAALAVTTTAGGPGGAPIISTAKGASTDGFLTSGDVHELAFSEAMHRDTAIAGAYEVEGQVGSETITCGDNAVCGLSTDRKTLRVRLDGTVPPVPYPLEITALTGMKDEGGTAATTSGSDLQIEQSTLSGDLTGPQIDAATLDDANSDNNFGAVGDKLVVSFDETVTNILAASSVSQDELRAVTGRSNITYGATTIVTLSVVGGDLVFEVTGANFSSGTNTGATIPGTDNPYVADSLGNPQRPNANPATLTAAS